jgi:hypothetical protein
MGAWGPRIETCIKKNVFSFQPDSENQHAYDVCGACNLRAEGCFHKWQSGESVDKTASHHTKNPVLPHVHDFISARSEWDHSVWQWCCVQGLHQGQYGELTGSLFFLEQRLFAWCFWEWTGFVGDGLYVEQYGHDFYRVQERGLWEMGAALCRYWYLRGLFTPLGCKLILCALGILTYSLQDIFTRTD